jgi:ATP-dependent Clp protease protease subunit
VSERGSDVFEKYHDYSVDLKRRRVFLYSRVYASWMDEDGFPLYGETDLVVKNLLWMDTTPGQIELWINTPGGVLEEMWAIYDAIRTATNHILTVALGNVSSAGCLLLAAGTGVRYAMPSASFMWHGGEECIPWTSITELEDRAAWARRETDRWVTTMARHTKPPGCRTVAKREAFWREHTVARELWLDAKQMVQHGIVDEIWTREEPKP